MPYERIRAQLVYLNEGVEQEVQVDDAAIAGFQQRMQESVERMHAVLADPAGNVPHPESHFPMTDQLQTCARCVFRRVCGREGAASQVA